MDYYTKSNGESQHVSPLLISLAIFAVTVVKAWKFYVLWFGMILVVKWWRDRKRRLAEEAERLPWDD